MHSTPLSQFGFRAAFIDCGFQLTMSGARQDDEFDSAAIGLSVRDPAFMPPHLLLSMSLPNNGPDFGRGGFRPVRIRLRRSPTGYRSCCAG
jgi:hypothetical protein